MSEVDQNLNYMLGQLSLVVQEFNQVFHSPVAEKICPNFAKVSQK
jgi:hypothetical protein